MSVYVCVHVYSCMCGCIYVWKPEVNLRIHYSGVSHLVFYTGFQWLCCLVRRAPRIGLSSTCSARITGQHYMFSFLHGFWGLNLRSCVLAQQVLCRLSFLLSSSLSYPGFFQKSMTTQVSQLKYAKWVGISGLKTTATKSLVYSNIS